MYDGPIIDTHHHIWIVKNYPWLTAAPSPKIFGSSYDLLRHDYLVNDLIKDFGGNNIVKSVHEQAHYNPPDHIGETRWLQSIADQNSYPNGIVGYADISASDIADVLDGHINYRNFRGIRQVVAWHPSKPEWQIVDRPDYCLSKKFHLGLEQLEIRGLHFELQGFPNQFNFFSKLITSHQSLRFCLVHGGLLVGDDEVNFDEWRRGIEMLSQFKNLYVKCSGLNVLNWTNNPRSLEAITRQYNAIIDMFGAERCFFGSNFPVEKIKISYDTVVKLCKLALIERTESEGKAFFHDTADDFYRLT